MLNLLFHSSEAIVGGSPYNRTESELSGFFDRLGRFFEYASRELHVDASYVRRVPQRPTRGNEDLPRHASPAAGPGGQRHPARGARQMGGVAR